MNQLVEKKISDFVEKKSVNDLNISNKSSGSYLQAESLADVVRFAEIMARTDHAIPVHLRGNPGACMAVTMQALEWGMSPFAVASKSYQVTDKFGRKGIICYEAQLIASIVNTRSRIEGNLKYEYSGSGDSLTCKVTGRLRGEDCVYQSPTVGRISPKNSPLWKTDPQQQLGYYSARAWARRYVPEVILGVYDREEAIEIQTEYSVEPKPSINERLAKTAPEPDPEPEPAVEPAHDEETGEILEEEAGFDPAHIEAEIKEKQGFDYTEFLYNLEEKCKESGTVQELEETWQGLQVEDTLEGSDFLQVAIDLYKRELARVSGNLI